VNPEENRYYEKGGKEQRLKIANRFFEDLGNSDTWGQHRQIKIARTAKARFVLQRHRKESVISERRPSLAYCSCPGRM
jgi:hypothetical protein